MKIEKFKTLLLIFLIGLSIYQTGELWFQPFSASEKPEEELVIDEIYIWDKIKPKKYLLLMIKIPQLIMKNIVMKFG